MSKGIGESQGRWTAYRNLRKALRISRRLQCGEVPAGIYLFDHLPTPYGDPRQGMLIYLNRHLDPGILINTLGLGAA